MIKAVGMIVARSYAQDLGLWVVAACSVWITVLMAMNAEASPLRTVALVFLAAGVVAIFAFIFSQGRREQARMRRLLHDGVQGVGVTFYGGQLITAEGRRPTSLGSGFAIFRDDGICVGSWDAAGTGHGGSSAFVPIGEVQTVRCLDLYPFGYYPSLSIELAGGARYSLFPVRPRGSFPHAGMSRREMKIELRKIAAVLGERLVAGAQET